MKAGDVYENPATGERVVIVEGSEDTGGEYGVADLYVQPGGAVAQAHAHATLVEAFEVLAGDVGFMLSGEEVTLGPGESATVEEGVEHDWWNAGESEARVRVRVSPGPNGNAESCRRFELMIETVFGLGRDGKTNDKGEPGLLQIAVMASEFRDIIVFSKPPPAIQRALFAVLAPIARMRGYEGIYPYGEPGREPGVQATKN